MEAREIEQYLAELGAELQTHGVDKITAGRDKDLVDCGILLPQTTIKTRQQAQELLDRYVLPGAQQKNATQIEKALNEIFKNQ